MRFALFCALLAGQCASAQPSEIWNFLSDPSIFRDVHGLLPVSRSRELSPIC